MPDFDEAPRRLSAKDDAAKTHALIAYGLMLLGLITGIFWFIGALWAMFKKQDAIGSVFEDHYANIITTFWWGLGLSILAFMLMIVGIGWLVLIAVWVWSIVKIMKGLAKITSNQAYHS